jgi:hypothetical protein
VVDTYKLNVEIIANDIASYLGRHVDAADTLEGITQWWLLRQRIEYSSLQVQEALEYLRDKGAIRSVKAGGQTIYSAAQPDNIDNHAG